MKTLNKFRNFLVAALLVCTASAFAQTITGGTSVIQGSTRTYSWTGPPSGPYVNYAHGTITVTGGIIVESNATTLPAPSSRTFNVRWTGAVGAGKISVVYYQHISPPQSNPFLAGPYTKELNVTIVPAPIAGLSGKQSVTLSENAIYSWNFVPPVQNAQYMSGTMKVVGGVFTENNSTSIAAGLSKNANVRWYGPVGSGSVSISYSYRVGPFGPINFYETVNKTETLAVSIAPGSSSCNGMAGSLGFASLIGNQCPFAGIVENYTWKYIPQTQLTFQSATIKVTGGVFLENNSTSLNVGMEKNAAVRWTTPGNQTISVTFHFVVNPGAGGPPNPVYQVRTITLPVFVSAASVLREMDEEEMEFEVATENLIYPNPATAGSEVFINNAGTSVEKVIVRNLEGQVQNASVTVGEKIAIATAGMKKGMYVVQVISTEGKSTTHKFSVE